MKQALRYLLLLLAVGIGLGVVVLQLRQPQPDPALIVIRQTEFIKSDEPTPPREAAWVQRQLPDNWTRTNPDQSGYGWYRASFVLAAAPSEAWAVYLPTAGTTYQMYVNGADVGTGGGMAGPIARSMGVPRLDPIAPQLLRPGANELLVRLRVASNLRGGLGQVTLGPRAAVEPLYRAAYFERVTLTRALNMALIFTGLLVFIMWLRRPQESIYGHFAALSIVWSIRNFHYTVSVPSLPSNAWEAFIMGSLGAVVVLLWLFVLRLTRTAHPRLERWLPWACAACTLLFAVIDPQTARAVRIPWYLLCAGLGAWTIAILLQSGLRPVDRRPPGVWVILAAAVITLGLGLTDLAVTAQLLPYGPAARMAFGAPLLLCALVYALADGYFRTFDEVRSLNTELERRVAERTLELERTHERLRSLERATTLAVERERMMRDMHDGIGSQLITTLNAVERGGHGDQGVAAMLRECIDDLRLVIDSLDPDEDSLAAALANLHYRLEPRLAAAGVALDWEVREGIALPTAGSVLQVLRIVQEAVTNALKHAGASRLRISARHEPGALVVEVQDDGRGFEPGATSAPGRSAGRGLHNMELRARQLGGLLQVDSNGAGTRLALRIPLPAGVGRIL